MSGDGRALKREGIAKALAEAVAMKESMRGRRTEGRTSRERWRDYATRWARDHFSGLEPSTVEKYTNAIAHANLVFGDHFVDAIEPKDVRTWRDSMREAYGARTINGWIRTMRVALDDAVDTGILRVNPARMTKTLPESQTTRRGGIALSPTQFRAFIGTVDQLRESRRLSPEIARMVLAAAWTGCRSGELRALRWEDWKDGELHIVRSVWRHREKATKTEDPRIVVVVEPLAHVLSEQRQWLLETQHPGLPSGLIFPTSERHAKAGATRRGADELSWFRSGSCLAPPLEMVANAAGVPVLSPHALRRTWEKLLRKANVDGLVRRSLAGWRSTDAQEIYTDVDAEDRAHAGEAVLRLVFGEKVTPDGDTRAEKHERPARCCLNRP